MWHGPSGRTGACVQLYITDMVVERELVSQPPGLRTSVVQREWKAEAATQQLEGARAPELGPRLTRCSQPSRASIAWMWTTALGFFSTAYTRSGTPDRALARMLAATSGPRPAPTTISTICCGLKPGSLAACGGRVRQWLGVDRMWRGLVGDIL